ncbi:MAG TPA: nucleotide exchange factor GrpE [Solirubrobacterales bacterium]|nr:nucleotide exchange factor GrpE [Solirubrobacterales bacterium]
MTEARDQQAPEVRQPTAEQAAEATPASAAPPAGEPQLSAAELAVELERMRNNYLRARADLENYRRRSAQEIERRALDAHEQLLRDWLEVVDSIDRALALDQGAELREGLRAVLEQMQSVLKRHGAERIDAEGQPFDPTLHEAVSTVPSAEAEPNTVLHVARGGWRLGDRVLRPAQVVVAKAPEEVRHGGHRDA